MKKKSPTKRGRNNPKKKVKRISDDTATFKGQMEPSKTKFGVKHILQAIVGATLLAVPIGFTEETWRLGETLPMWNIVAILIISLFFIAIFVYRNFSRNIPNFYWTDLLKRIITIYIISFLIVALLLTVIQRAPWTLDWILAIKRTIIVTFPSALSAAIAGNLR
jgi:uncharacterized membrane protein